MQRRLAGGSVWYYEKDIGVHHVGGLRQESHFSLQRHCDALRQFWPPDIIPFADDPFGNAICLGFRGTSAGCVYFWDHESAFDPPRLIAGSFSKFVDALEPEREESG